MSIESILNKVHERLVYVEKQTTQKKISKTDLDDMEKAIKESNQDIKEVRSLKDTHVNADHTSDVTKKIKKSLNNIENFIKLQNNPTNQQQAGFLQTQFLKIIADFQDSLKNLETEMDKRKVKKVSGDPLDKR